MTTSSSLPALLTDGVALLERSMSFTLGGLLLVTPAALTNPTPCAEWDLRDLLLHMNESLQALHEAIAVGHLELDPTADISVARADYGDPYIDPVATLKRRACTMVGAWVCADDARGPGTITVAERSLTTEVVAAAGAVEVAVHGWDVARACGADRPVPPSLAEELLALCAVFVDDGDRPHRFGSAVRADPAAAAGDRLVALLGRRPR
jgi:uncharacterized protein (TIGR03086 family)